MGKVSGALQAIPIPTEHVKCESDSGTFTYMRTAALCPSSRYPYRGMAYANPDAVTQIANGLSTTTFQYDNNGNVTQKTTDGTTTTYIYDYANRLTALGAGGATTTYSYDAFGARILQTGTSTTTFYPFKWYTVASSTGSARSTPRPPRMCVATGTAAARVRGAAGRLRQAGLRKQAARRWLAAQGARLSRHDPVYLGDDLYTRQPIRAAVRAVGSHFLFVCKPSRTRR